MSAVVQHGLELLRERTEDRETEIAALRLLLERRMKGPFISGEESRKRTQAMIARKTAELGL